ncbi:VanZ family protein [Peribacillus frigoritolerans]|uniref:VanZ family protein n=1 Tax=Peribacillus frigoritolerans TaxID=450367 RepID=UPI00301726C1
MFIKKSVNVLFLFSLLLIVTLTLLYPFPTSISTISYVKSNYIPFVVIRDLLTSYSFLSSMYNIIGNIILFMPLGFLLPFKYKRINKYVKSALVGFIVSVFIELTQLLLPYRQTDIDDVILNTLGTGIGYGLYNLWINIVSEKQKKL